MTDPFCKLRTANILFIHAMFLQTIDLYALMRFYRYDMIKTSKLRLPWVFVVTYATRKTLKCHRKISVKKLVYIYTWNNKLLFLSILSVYMALLIRTRQYSILTNRLQTWVFPENEFGPYYIVRFYSFVSADYIPFIF